MNYKKIAKTILKNYTKVKNGTTATTNGKQYRYSNSNKRRFE